MKETTFWKETAFRTLVVLAMFLLAGLPARGQDTVAVCDTVALPYVMDFDSLVPYSSSASDYDLLPPCWHNTYTGTLSMHRRLVTSRDGNVCLGVSTSTIGVGNVRHAIATPLLALQGQEVRVVFDYGKTTIPSLGIELGLMTDPDDLSSFVPLDTLVLAQQDRDWHEYERYFDADSLEAACLAFRRAEGSQTGTVYIDNLLVEVATACRRPVAATVGDITDASALVYWTGEPGVQYEVRYCQVDTAPAYQYLTVSDALCALSMLEPDTVYRAWVRPLCDSALARPWLDAGTFRTERACYPLAAVRLTQESSDHVCLEWEFDENHYRGATEVQVRWYADASPSQDSTITIDASHRTAFVGPLSGGTAYNFELTTLCFPDTATAVVLHHTTGDMANYRPLLSAATGDSNSIVAEWYGMGSTYRLSYCNAADEEWTTLTVGGIQHVLTSLEPSTVYALCVSEQFGPIWVSSDTLRVATGCGTLHVPYHVVYDGHAPQCWTMAVANTRWVSGVDFVIGGAGVALLPEADEDMAGLQVTLDYTKYNGGVCTLQVGVGESPTDTSLIQWLHTIVFAGPNQTQGDTLLPLDQYAGTGRHLALRTVGTGSCFAIDRLHLDYLNACPLVQQVRVDEVEATQALLSWSPAGVAQYQVVLSHQGLKDTVYTNDTLALIAGLLPTTDYTVRVYAICAAGDTALSSRPVSFHTLCDEYAVLPYHEPFAVGSRLPECWAAPVEATVNSNAYPHVWNQVLYLRDGCMAVSPLMPADGNRLHVSFRAYSFGVGGATAGVMSDPTDTSTFIPILALPSTIAAGTVYEFATDTVAACLAGENYHVAFRTASGQIEIDDLRVNSLDQCRAPQYGGIDGATMHSIAAHWMGTGAEAYRVVCASATDTLAVVTDSTAVTIGGLATSTRYALTVSAICGTDTTEALALGSTVTDHDLMPLPYSMDFQITTAMPEAWEAANCGMGATVRVGMDLSDLNHLGNLVLYNLGCQAITPRFVVPAEGLHVSFRVRGAQGDGQRAHMDCYTARVTADEVQLDSTLQWRCEAFVYLTHDSLLSFTVTDLPAGDTVAVVLQSDQWPAHVTIDDFLIEALARDTLPAVEDTCRVPTGLTATHVDSTGATLAWTADSSQDRWELELIGHGRYTVTAPTLTLGSLQPATEYRAAVRALCADSLYSDWSGTLLFTTDSLTPSLPDDTVDIDDRLRADSAELSVFPNPAAGDVTVKVGQPSTVTVADLLGRTVIAPTRVESSFVIPHTSLPRGTYFVNAKTPDGVAVRRLVVR